MFITNTPSTSFIFSFDLLISLNPLTPKSDLHLISPNNIILESHIKVTRIKEMITNKSS